MSTHRPASLKRIAEQAGVSMMTVSRAIRGENNVAGETAEKILRIAEAMRYRPNKLVQGLRTGRTDMVAAVLPSSLGFYQDALCSIEHSLDEKGCSLILNLVSGHEGRDAMREEIRRLRRCIELRVDGIILRPVNDDANALYFREAIERKVPMVVIDRRLPDFQSDFVGTDDFAGGQEAARILVSRGCRNLAVVFAGEKISTSRDRRDGFLKAAAEAGLQAAAIDCGSFRANPDILHAAFTQPSGRGIDGIFAVGDRLAAASLSILEGLGKSCPGDFKLLGFGCEFDPETTPRRIASFNQHAGLVGSEAVELIFGRLSKPSRPVRSVLVPADFTEGDTL
jgi:LacI family transcriptional regulator